MEEVFAVLHEVDLLEEEVRLLLAETLLSKHLLGSLLELVIGSLDLLDVDLLFLIHLDEPLVDDLLLSWTHGSETVEEGSGPHDLGHHDHLVDQSVGISDQLLGFGVV